MRGVKKPVKAYRIVTKEVYFRTYHSIEEAGSELNVNTSNIRKVLRGDRNKVGKFTFRQK